MILSFINILGCLEFAPDTVQFAHFGANTGKRDGEALRIGKQKRLEFVELNIGYKTRVAYIGREALLKKFNFFYRVDNVARFSHRRKIRWQPV